MMSNSDARKRASAPEPTADIEALLAAELEAAYKSHLRNDRAMTLSESAAAFVVATTPTLAAVILASDWLARRDVAQRAAALEEVAARLNDDLIPGIDCACTGIEDAVQEWLRDRAYRIEQEARDERA